MPVVDFGATMHDENALQIQLTNAEFEALADYISSWPMPLTPTDAAEMLLHDALIGSGLAGARARR